jgi:hypothetical protein
MMMMMMMMKKNRGLENILNMRKDKGRSEKRG